MALLTVEQRKIRFKYLGLGEYNAENIKKFQKKYLRAKDADGIYGTNTDNLLRHVYNVKKYTKNFSPEEFKCECGGRYCTGYPTYMKKVELENLQSIRAHFGKPMTITCGMRCRPYNNSLRGSISNSKHLTGYATDFYMKGVTDTLANRKTAIKWIKKLPNHNYTYGNGINSYGYSIAASYMGNALHTDTNKPPAVKVTTTLAAAASTTSTTSTKKLNNREKLAKYAWKYAYHTNTKKASYPSGSAKPEYKAALDKAFGKNRKWQTSAKKGASCDVFVATCIRMAGIDKNAPRGMGRSYLDKSKKFKRVKVTSKTIKDGDIISIVWKNGNPHWCIAYKGYILEASLKGWYPKRTNTLKSRLSKSGKSSVIVYRAVSSTTKKTTTKTTTATKTTTTTPVKTTTTTTSDKKVTQYLTKAELDKWFAALKKQYENAKDSVYVWVEGPTYANSHKKSTCIAEHSVALQLLGLLPKGGYFYFHPKKKKISGNRASYVKKHTELFKLWYPNTKLTTMVKKGTLQPGDIVGFGNPAYHSMVYMGTNSKGKPIFTSLGHNKKYKQTYSSYENRKVNMVVRLKKVSK